MKRKRQRWDLIRTGAAAIMVALAAACADTPELPTTAASPSTVQTPANAFLASTGADGEKSKEAKVKRYRVKVDHKRKVIDAQTEFVTTSTIDPPENCLEPEGCTGTSIIYSGEFDVSGETYDTTNTGQPWDPAYAEMGEEGTRWHCKQRIDKFKFTHKEYAFQVEEEKGDAVYIGPAQSRSWGVVKGRYQLPKGPHLSTNGKAEVLSGVVEGLCYFQYERVGLLLVEWGNFISVKFIGQWRVLPNDVPGGGTGGGGLGGSGGGDSDAIAVFLNFLDTGTCTPGWVIVIDGVRYC